MARRVDDVRQLDEAVAEELKTNAETWVYIYASVDPETGKSWCPDCVKVDEPVRKLLATKPSSIDVAAGDKPTWRDPEHPLRVHSQYQLTGVPTLARVGADGSFEKWTEEAIDPLLQ